MLKNILFALLAVAGTRGSLEPTYYKGLFTFTYIHTYIIIFIFCKLFQTIESKLEGESCSWDRFPNATCQYKENCKLLSKLVESGEINIRKVPTCRFQSANPNEMFCCPKDPVVEDPSISPKHPQTPQHQFTVSVNSKEYVRSHGYYPHISYCFQYYFTVFTTWVPLAIIQGIYWITSIAVRALYWARPMC